MLKRVCSFLIPALLLVGGTSFVRAQTATGINDLTFGNVLPGVAKTISKRTAGAAAEYSVSGTAGEQVLIDFSLPSHMTSNGDNLLLSFSATDCAIDSSDPGDQSAPAWDNIDPRNTLAATLGSGGLTIWLGGRVQPSSLQPTGSYTAEIVLTVSPAGT